MADPKTTDPQLGIPRPEMADPGTAELQLGMHAASLSGNTQMKTAPCACPHGPHQCEGWHPCDPHEVVIGAPLWAGYNGNSYEDHDQAL